MKIQTPIRTTREADGDVCDACGHVQGSKKKEGTGTATDPVDSTDDISDDDLRQMARALVRQSKTMKIDPHPVEAIRAFEKGFRESDSGSIRSVVRRRDGIDPATAFEDAYADEVALSRFLH